MEKALQHCHISNQKPMALSLSKEYLSCYFNCPCVTAVHKRLSTSPLKWYQPTATCSQLTHLTTSILRNLSFTSIKALTTLGGIYELALLSNVRFHSHEIVGAVKVCRVPWHCLSCITPLAISNNLGSLFFPSFWGKQSHIGSWLFSASTSSDKINLNIS